MDLTINVLEILVGILSLFIVSFIAIFAYDRVTARRRHMTEVYLQEVREELQREKLRRAEAEKMVEKVEKVAAGGQVDLDEVRRLQERRDAEDFKRNCKSTILVESLEFRSLPVLGDGTWKLQSGNNVLLGRNGYGKSLVLRELAAILTRSDKKSVTIAGDGLLKVILNVDGQSREIERSSSGFKNSLGPVPILAIPDSRFVNRAEDALRPVRDPYTEISRYGAYHFLEQVPYNTIVQSLLHSLCLDYVEHDPRTFEQPIFQLLTTVFAGLTDKSFRFSSVERADATSYHLKVITEGNEKPVLIQAASQGTLSVLAIFGLIYRFLTDARDEDKETALHRRAVVIIDELDAHLHPSWQQRIVGLLRKTFPNVQFIISGHSPLLVAGAGLGEVSVMRKMDLDLGFHIQTLDRDFIGAKAEDIYQTAFNITDGADDVFIEHSKLAASKVDNKPKIRELRELRAKEQLSHDEELELTQLENQEVLMRRASAIEEERAQEADILATLETECSELRIKVRDLEHQLMREQQAQTIAKDLQREVHQDKRLK